MSLSRNWHEAERWLQTAEEDLKAAQTLAEHRMFAQACFYAQQSAEKAVKALWYATDANPWGHSIQRLITEFPNQSEIVGRDDWIRQGALLDQFYIPTRYPNGLPDLTPGQIYRQEDADRALAASRKLVSLCREWITEHAPIVSPPELADAPSEKDLQIRDEEHAAQTDETNDIPR